MTLNRNFTQKLDKCIEKYAKRKNILEEPCELFLDETDETFIEKMAEYKFYYDVIDSQKDVFDLMSLIDGQKGNEKIVTILFFDLELVEALKEATEFSGLFSTSPEIELNSLYTSINLIRKKYLQNNNQNLKLIIDFLQDLYKDNYAKMDKLIEQGLLDYNSVWYYFDHPDTVYQIEYFGKKICMKYEYFEYVTGESHKLDLTGKILYIKDGKIKEGYVSYQIEKFSGNRKINTFEIIKLQEVSDDIKNELLNNGKKTVELKDCISHMYLIGDQYIGGKQITKYLRDNRIIVDNKGLEKFSTPVFNFEFIKNYEKDMEDEDFMRLFPFVGVYSMGTSKCWGMAHIQSISEIEYQDNSFNYLVLDKNKKDILQALIKNHRKDLKDFIRNKGQGLIFLLNGPPGVGKTLTAEATSEYLHRPLYSIHVGDLGTNPEDMESIMERILEYCDRWNAIILVDEADIFLEEREYSNVMRNAMVSTFMKFLEYNKGIMFLTTNRLSSIDEAVKSRVNMFFTYKKLGFHTRLDVWKSLLSKWNLNLNDSTVEQLAEYEFNGREIRNYMRLVMSIIKDRNLNTDDETVLEIIQECFDLTNEFNDNVGVKHMYN